MLFERYVRFHILVNFVAAQSDHRCCEVHCVAPYNFMASRHIVSLAPHFRE